MTRPASRGRAYAGESADERTERRRRELLRAGLELFGEQGYRHTTVRQLCREAKVADRVFYDLFDGTEDLLLAVYHHCLDRLQDAVRDALDHLEPQVDDVGELARAGLSAFFEQVGADRNLARVVWVEVLGVSPRIEAAYMERTRRFGSLLLDLIDERGIAAHAGDNERRVVVSALVGGVSQVILDWVYEGFSAPSDQLVAPLVGFMRAAVTAPPAPRA